MKKEQIYIFGGHYVTWKTAPPWRRVSAFLVDTIVLLPFMQLTSTISYYLTPLLILFYYVWMESSSLQKTLGKSFMALKVETEDGGRITKKQALVRYLGKLLSVLILGMGYYPIFYNKRALCDKLAHTRVMAMEVIHPK